MSRAVDYSKWDNIELSDDDTADLPPMIDKNSFKKYQSTKRNQRDEEEEKEIKELKTRIEKNTKCLKQIGEAGREHVKGKKMQSEMEEDTIRLDKLTRTMHRRLNADKLCKTTKDCINSTKLSSVAAKKEGYQNFAPEIDNNVDEKKFEEFAYKHEDILLHYVDELSEQPLYKSCQYILEHPEILLSSDTETYCLFHCLGLEMDGLTKRMKKACRQEQLITQCLELSKAMNGGLENLSSDGVSNGANTSIKLNRRGTEQMFDKLQGNDDESESLRASFNEQVKVRIEKIKVRAAEKLKEDTEIDRLEKMKISDNENSSKSSNDTNSNSKDTKINESAESSKPPKASAQVGPGGLNAQEVFESLPEILQEAFFAKDAQKLQEAFETFPKQKAQDYMQKCIAGGLWVMPGQGQNDGRDTDSECEQD